MQQTLEFQLSLLRMMSRLENPRPALKGAQEAVLEEAMTQLVARASTVSPRA